MKLEKDRKYATLEGSVAIIMGSHTDWETKETVYIAYLLKEKIAMVYLPTGIAQSENRSYDLVAQLRLFSDTDKNQHKKRY